MREIADLWNQADRVVCVTIGRLEVRAAIARRLRGGAAEGARRRLEEQEMDVEWVAIDDALVRSASRLVDRHRLRTLDALHLAAAVALRERGLVLMSWDADLVRAASSEGLVTAP